MPRPRFHLLPAAQQAAILDAALDEFATHGYRRASLNRIIETAAVSKGSMYYYFDGKEDLYTHVVHVQIQRLFQQSGPLAIPDAPTPDGFWATLEHYYLHLMGLLTASPDTAALLRHWLTDPVAPPLREAQHEAEQAMLPWLAQTVVAGQRVGAVRTDLPAELIIAIAMGMGQATDTWLITRTPDDSDLSEIVHALIDMMRRALGP